MRELHAIGLTRDGQHLLLSASPDAVKPSHRIAVDARFEAVLRGKRVTDPTSGPALSVQAMQARLRSGATVEEVAAAAGLPVSRVERFAGPVRSEREEVLRKVFASHQNARRGRSNVELGRAVAIALEAVANVRLETVEWTAYRKADGAWVAAVSVFARGRVRRAEWSFDDAGRAVRPLDAWASMLGHREAVTGSPPEKASPVKRTPGKATVTKPVPAKKTPAKTMNAKKMPAGNAPAANAPAAKAPSAKAQAKAPAANRAPAKRAGAKATVGKPAPTKKAAQPAGGARRAAS